MLRDKGRELESGETKPLEMFNEQVEGLCEVASRISRSLKGDGGIIEGVMLERAAGEAAAWGVQGREVVNGTDEVAKAPEYTGTELGDNGQTENEVKLLETAAAWSS